MAKQLLYGEEARRALKKASISWRIPLKLPWAPRAATLCSIRSLALR